MLQTPAANFSPSHCSHRHEEHRYIPSHCMNRCYRSLATSVAACCTPRSHWVVGDRARTRASVQILLPPPPSKSPSAVMAPQSQHAWVSLTSQRVSTAHKKQRASEHVWTERKKRLRHNSRSQATNLGDSPEEPGSGK